MSQDDEHILNQIRAFANAPGAYVLLKGKKFKILKASYLNEHNEFGLLVKPVMDCASFFNGQGRNLVGNIVE